MCPTALCPSSTPPESSTSVGSVGTIRKVKSPFVSKVRKETFWAPVCGKKKNLSKECPPQVPHGQIKAIRTNTLFPCERITQNLSQSWQHPQVTLS